MHFQKPKHHLKSLPKGTWKRLKDLQRRRHFPLEDIVQDSLVDHEAGTLLLPIVHRSEHSAHSGAIPKTPKDADQDQSSRITELRLRQFHRDIRTHPFTDTNVERGRKQQDTEVEEDIDNMPSDKDNQE